MKESLDRRNKFYLIAGLICLISGFLPWFAMGSLMSSFASSVGVNSFAASFQTAGYFLGILFIALVSTGDSAAAIGAFIGIAIFCIPIFEGIALYQMFSKKDKNKFYHFSKIAFIFSTVLSTITIIFIIAMKASAGMTIFSPGIGLILCLAAGAAGLLVPVLGKDWLDETPASQKTAAGQSDQPNQIVGQNPQVYDGIDKRIIYYSILAVLGIIAALLPWMSIHTIGLSGAYSLGSGFTFPSNIKKVMDGTADVAQFLGINLTDVFGTSGLSGLFGFSLLIFVEPILFGFGYYYLLVKKDINRFTQRIAYGLIVSVVMPFIYMIICANLNQKVQQAVGSLDVLGLANSSSVKVFHVNAGLVIALIIGLAGTLYPLLMKQQIKNGQKVSSLNMELFGNRSSGDESLINRPAVSSPKPIQNQELVMQNAPNGKSAPAAIIPNESAVLTLRLMQSDKYIDIHAFPAVIGSDSKQATQVLPDPTVDAAHCRLIVNGGHVLIHDLHSSKGVAIDGARIPSDDYFTLFDGDQLTIGAVELKVDIDQDALEAYQAVLEKANAEPRISMTDRRVNVHVSEEPEASRAAECENVESTEAANQPLCTFTSLDPNIPSFDVRTTPFTIGNLNMCDYTLNYRGISRNHATIILDDHSQQLVIIDHSKNGTYVDNCIIGREKSVQLRTGVIVMFFDRAFRVQIFN